MKRIIYIYSIIALALGMASCSTEASLQCGIPKREGRVLASALSVELKTDEKLVRSSGVPDVSDFTVDFIKADNLEDSPVKHFRYGDMPEVVTLPVGEYVARLIMVETMAAKGEGRFLCALLSWRVWPLHNQRE